LRRTGSSSKPTNGLEPGTYGWMDFFGPPDRVAAYDRRMAKLPVWDVEPRPKGRWAVQREGTTRASSLHDRKVDAVARGVDLGRRYQGELRIKGKNGQIQDERTYGRDPNPPARS
jgi:hypothetical protein